MNVPIKFLIAFSILTPAVAGCLEDPVPEPKTLSLAGLHAFLAIGDGYNGSGVQQFSQGVLTAFDIDGDTNTGHVVATGKRDGKVWRIECKEFAQQGPDKTFQDGGVARHLLEHGDSGNGDTSVPKFLAEAAAWGTGTVLVDGLPHPDEVSLEPEWSCHLMATKQGFRDDKSFAIYKDASKSAFYEREPGTGLVTLGDDEAHLQLKADVADATKVVQGHNRTGRLETNNTKVTLVQTNAEPRVYLAANTPYPKSVLAFSLELLPPGSDDSTQPPIPWPQEHQNLRPKVIAKLVKKGTPAALATAEVTVETPEVTQSVTLPDPGEYEFHVTGEQLTPSSLAWSFRLKMWTLPPPPLVYNFWYEDIRWGPDARSLEPFHLKSETKQDATDGTGAGIEAPAA